MPKLWHDTIEAHRNAVADAVMDKTAAIAAAEGVHALTMARIAQESGIGRATLYKYFKDVEDILTSWHRRQIVQHLDDLEQVRSRHESPLKALEAVLLAYAGHASHSHDASLGLLLHGMPHMSEAHSHLQNFIAGIIAEAGKAGELKSGSSASEGARYALAAVQGAPVKSKPELSRLVTMVLRGLGA